MHADHHISCRYRYAGFPEFSHRSGVRQYLQRFLGSFEVLRAHQNCRRMTFSSYQDTLDEFRKVVSHRPDRAHKSS